MTTSKRKGTDLAATAKELAHKIRCYELTQRNFVANWSNKSEALGPLITKKILARWDAHKEIVALSLPVVNAIERNELAGVVMCEAVNAFRALRSATFSPPKRNRQSDPEHWEIVGYGFIDPKDLLDCAAMCEALHTQITSKASTPAKPTGKTLSPKQIKDHRKIHYEVCHKRGLVKILDFTAPTALKLCEGDEAKARKLTMTAYKDIQRRDHKPEPKWTR